jgi:hypothetical protein
MIMKKIIALLVVMLALGFSAGAQEKSVRPVQKTALSAEKMEAIKVAAVKDADALGQVITFKGSDRDNFVNLFSTKHRMYAQELSAERKALVAQTIERKLKATLSAEDLQKVEATPGLMKKLTEKQ